MFDSSSSSKPDKCLDTRDEIAKFVKKYNLPKPSEPGIMLDGYSIPLQFAYLVEDYVKYLVGHDFTKQHCDEIIIYYRYLLLSLIISDVKINGLFNSGLNLTSLAKGKEDDNEFMKHIEELKVENEGLKQELDASRKQYQEVKEKLQLSLDEVKDLRYRLISNNRSKSDTPTNFSSFSDISKTQTVSETKYDEFEDNSNGEIEKIRELEADVELLREENYSLKKILNSSKTSSTIEEDGMESLEAKKRKYKMKYLSIKEKYNDNQDLNEELMKKNIILMENAQKNDTNILPNTTEMLEYLRKENERLVMENIDLKREVEDLTGNTYDRLVQRTRKSKYLSMQNKSLLNENEELSFTVDALANNISNDCENYELKEKLSVLAHECSKLQDDVKKYKDVITDLKQQNAALKSQKVHNRSESSRRHKKKSHITDIDLTEPTKLKVALTDKSTFFKEVDNKLSVFDGILHEFDHQVQCSTPQDIEYIKESCCKDIRELQVDIAFLRSKIQDEILNSQHGHGYKFDKLLEEKSQVDKENIQLKEENIALTIENKKLKIENDILHRRIEASVSLSIHSTKINKKLLDDPEQIKLVLFENKKLKKELEGFADVLDKLYVNDRREKERTAEIIYSLTNFIDGIIEKKSVFHPLLSNSSPICYNPDVKESVKNALSCVKSYLREFGDSNEQILNILSGQSLQIPKSIPECSLIYILAKLVICQHCDQDFLLSELKKLAKLCDSKENTCSGIIKDTVEFVSVIKKMFGELQSTLERYFSCRSKQDDKDKMLHLCNELFKFLNSIIEDIYPIIGYQGKLLYFPESLLSFLNNRYEEYESLRHKCQEIENNLEETLKENEKIECECDHSCYNALSKSKKIRKKVEKELDDIQKRIRYMKFENSNARDKQNEFLKQNPKLKEQKNDLSMTISKLQKSNSDLKSLVYKRFAKAHMNLEDDLDDDTV